MNISSMTGFARADGALGTATWPWEVRSVNGRGLDLRMRLPPGLRGPRAQVREGIAQAPHARQRHGGAQRLARSSAATVRLNDGPRRGRRRRGGLRERLGAEPCARGSAGAARACSRSSKSRTIEAHRRAHGRGDGGSLTSALDGIVVARRAEGGGSPPLIEAQLEEVERLARRARPRPRDRRRQSWRASRTVARLLETGQGLDRERLHQEAVLIATRADVEEELQRLTATLVRRVTSSIEPGAVGRKLDFLAQEFNREANTLCSKAATRRLRTPRAALKVVIDQLREQVQNVE